MIWISIHALDTTFDGNYIRKIIALTDGAYPKTPFVGTVDMRLVILDPATKSLVPRKSATFAQLSVHRAYRGQGIGKRLMEYCIEQATRIGCETIGCQIDADNLGVQDFYKKLGFVVGYHYEDGSLLMCKPLEPVAEREKVTEQ